MNKLGIFYDKNHKEPEVLKRYLLEVMPAGILEEMYFYDGLENDLLNNPNVDDFLRKYFNKIPGLCKVNPSVNLILQYVITNKSAFWAIGEDDNEMLTKINSVISNNTFQGIYSLIIGVDHKDFVEAQLVPLFKKKFQKITYHS